ncbi:MAG: tyrosine-type recombinase/integrase [Acidovorax sp.]
MGTSGNGVEIREKSIRLFFVHEGQRCRETLTVAGKPAAPTAANVKYAHRVAAEIRDKLRLGTFVLAEYFPDSPRAASIGPTAVEKNFGQWCDLWLETKGRLAKRTLSQYTSALKVWQSLLGAETPMTKLTHAVISAKVGGHPWKSAKLLNNYLIPLRGVFALAKRELKIEDPMEGVENSKHQAAQPDPLAPDEMERILADLRERYDPRIAAYYEFAFMTGMRPEELIELRWGDVDWANETIRVERARTAGEVKPLKTYNARDVDLVGRALAALEVMKPWTTVGATDEKDRDLGRHIFENPVTNRPWHDERSQREHYWTPALRRLGIRRRRSYQTRHTYAANALAAGVNPAYIARQMGHKNAQMLFSVYAKWIDGADRGREKAKLEAALRNEKAARNKAA